MLILLLMILFKYHLKFKYGSQQQQGESAAIQVIIDSSLQGRPAKILASYPRGIHLTGPVFVGISIRQIGDQVHRDEKGKAAGDHLKEEGGLPAPESRERGDGPRSGSRGTDNPEGAPHEHQGAE